MWGEKKTTNPKPVELGSRCIAEVTLVWYISFIMQAALKCETLESGYCTIMEDYALLHLKLKCQGAFMLCSNRRILLGDTSFLFFNA